MEEERGRPRADGAERKAPLQQLVAGLWDLPLLSILSNGASELVGRLRLRCRQSRLSELLLHARHQAIDARLHGMAHLFNDGVHGTFSTRAVSAASPVHTVDAVCRFTSWADSFTSTRTPPP